MIVYGDAEFKASAGELFGRIESLASATDPNCLDDLRRLLIQAGQFEQALTDADCARESAEAIVDAVAAAFVAKFFESPGLHTEAARIANAIAQMKNGLCPDKELRVKIPEGFEFYTLFPEQYCVTAQRWTREREKTDVLVVGVRSIGTTLSAIVAATLERNGLRARRLTVRPGGHPFDRKVALPPFQHTQEAIVVDEGPGLSGSSMASIAQALSERGVEAISFFPGSAAEPGCRATPETRAWWAKTKRCFTSLHELKWGGRSLEEELAARTARVLGSAVVKVEDLSAGAWRECAYGNPAEWPPVAAAFERTKLRMATKSGGALLWKFCGFGSAGGIWKQWEARARLGWTTAPLAKCLGFIGTRWIEGERLTCRDATAQVLEQLALYIGDAAGPALSPAEASAAVQRLQHMMQENGNEVGETFYDGACEVDGLVGVPSAGDGRMTPHEWIWTEEDRLVKTGAHDHSCDHTIIGQQPFLWDVAGAIVEWNLEESQIAAFLDALQKSGVTIEPIALDFYIRAYAAFQMGLMLFAAEAASTDEERRLRVAAEEYRRRAKLTFSMRRELAAM